MFDIRGLKFNLHKTNTLLLFLMVDLNIIVLLILHHPENATNRT